MFKSHAELFRYLKEMNIDHNIMEFILDTPPEDIFILENDQLLDFNLVTELVKMLNYSVKFDPFDNDYRNYNKFLSIVPYV